MADFIFKISPNIVLGSYTASRLGQQVQEYGNRFMLIMDPILKENGNSQKITQSLSARQVDFFVFDDIPVVADTQVVERALKLARDSRVQGVIAAGGSKTLSLAKVVASLAKEEKDLYYFVDGDTPTTSGVPLICLPTTIRDAFIFMDSAPVVDARSSKLKLIKTQNGLCRLVIWDPNLTVTLTQKQLASMGIETLCMAIEGYLSQRASFFSDMLTEKAVQLLGWAEDGSPSLTITTPKEVLVTQGGCMASLGMASSSMGVASLLAQSINARYKISRSLTSAILLPYVIEDGQTFREDRLARISRILRAAKDEHEDKDAVKLLSDYVRQRIAKANLPARLKDLGITIEQLSLAAEDAGETELMNSLARSMNTDDLFSLIKQAF